MMLGQGKTAACRFDTVGSFLRPERLKRARAEWERGSVSKEELKAAEDEAIDVYKRQPLRPTAGLNCLPR